jgi:hypothetical protein
MVFGNQNFPRNGRFGKEIIAEKDCRAQIGAAVVREMHRACPSGQGVALGEYFSTSAGAVRRNVA